MKALCKVRNELYEKQKRGIINNNGEIDDFSIIKTIGGF